jgi:GMP synthase (glutamine-hydrolysing)
MSVQDSAPAVLLQHQDDAPPGLLLDVLQARGLTWRIVRVDRAERPPDPSSVALTVVLGSDASAAEAPPEWMADEIDWLRSADRAGATILGLGFGAQALALALGGGAERADRPSRGWIRVSTADPQSIAPGPWFAWQSEVIRMPPRAQLLAHNATGPQAYRAGSHLGIQFHPEITPDIITKRVYGESTHGVDTQGVLEATSREFKAAAGAATHLLSSFVASTQPVRR